MALPFEAFLVEPDGLTVTDTTAEPDEYLQTLRCSCEDLIEDFNT
jgi:hypothetical protein